MNDIRRDLKSFDFLLFFMVIALGAFGVLMVGSTTGLGSGNVSGMFVNQIIFFATGIVVMLVAAFVNYELIAKFYIPIYIINVVLLIIVMLIPRQPGEVARWLGVRVGGVELGIQPSELSKILTLIFLAKVIDKNRDGINHPLIVGLVVLTTMISSVLIFRQPALSASVVLIFIMAALLYTGKLSYKYIIGVTVIAVPILLYLFVDMHREPGERVFLDMIPEYQLGRIWYFLYPELDVGFVYTYQNVRAINALNSGMLQGRGLFQNTIFVPESTNDFIFAIIGAELGFIGSVLTLAAATIIILRMLIIANRSDVFLGRLIASGAAAAMAFQVFTHVGINVWLLPNTGMSFPFVSSGGSALWVFMAMTGLVLNVGMTRTKSMFDEM